MRWKWILVVVGGVIVVLIVAVYIILSTYNFNYLKPYITRTAKEATGRELTLGGDIHLKISLTPALVVDNVSFQNAPWGSRPETAKIRQFEIQVALPSPDLGKRGFPVSIHPHEVTKLGRRIENSFRVSLQEEKGTEIACFPDGVRTGGEEGSGPAWFPISVTGIP